MPQEVTQMYETPSSPGAAELGEQQPFRFRLNRQPDSRVPQSEVTRFRKQLFEWTVTNRDRLLVQFKYASAQYEQFLWFDLSFDVHAHELAVFQFVREPFVGLQCTRVSAVATDECTLSLSEPIS